MFLLKEVNDEEQIENWSLVEHIQQQIKERNFFRTWTRAGEWIFGFTQGFPYYQGLYKGDRQANIAKGLSYIAATNLKKSGGAGSSNYDVIKKHALDEKDLWTKEIEIVKPDVVICGGTFHIVRDILGFDCKTCGSGASIGQALGTKFIDLYHPMYRISPKLLYAYFKETMVSLGYSVLFSR